jgi:hypothetical protein
VLFKLLADDSQLSMPTKISRVSILALSTLKEKHRNLSSSATSDPGENFCEEHLVKMMIRVIYITGTILQGCTKPPFTTSNRDIISGKHASLFLSCSFLSKDFYAEKGVLPSATHVFAESLSTFNRGL